MAFNNLQTFKKTKSMFKFIKDKSKTIGKVLKYIATIITLTVSTFFLQSCVGGLV